MAEKRGMHETCWKENSKDKENKRVNLECDLGTLRELLGTEVMLDGSHLCPPCGGLERLALIIHAHLEAMHLCLRA